MRINYRSEANKSYWHRRWSDVAADSSMENTDTYPLKYAIAAVAMARPGRILEAGCGNGRILRWFHEHGYAISGMDFIGEAVDKIKQADPSVDVETGDILRMQFADATFETVLAFGLYHNLLPELQDAAFAETRRVLAPSGILCASFRADNLCTWFSDWLHARKMPVSSRREFHKLNLTEKEFRDVLERNGFEILRLEYVVNMPILYKFSIFRHASHKKFDEHQGRREGYRLNVWGAMLWNVLMRYCPQQACNIHVSIARLRQVRAQSS